MATNGEGVDEGVAATGPPVNFVLCRAGWRAGKAGKAGKIGDRCHAQAMSPAGGRGQQKQRAQSSGSAWEHDSVAAWQHCGIAALRRCS
jgi:hypothetical protein